MEHNFWHERWEKNEIGFHQNKPNALLEKHFKDLSLTPGQRVFVPLCGKTLDIGWLLAKGYRVVGAELSETAIQQLFEDLGVPPEISELGPLTRYRARDIDIFVGDIFALDGETLGPVDAVYDRAALVALPEGMREDYVAHVRNMTATAPQFLLTFDYDQAEMPGPPFAIDDGMVRKYYAADYDIERLEELDVTGGLKGRVAAREVAWRLRQR